MRIASFFLIALLASCGRTYPPASEQSLSLPPIAPDYCDVVMPRNMALPSFTVEGTTHLRAEIDCEGEQVTLEGEEIALEELRGVVDRNLRHPKAPKTPKVPKTPAESAATLTVTLSAWSPSHPDGIRYAPFTVTLSPDTIDRFLTYRLIPPGYEGWHSMGIYRRDLTSFEETPLVTISNSQDGCVNCHTSCWGDARRYLYHRRGEGGGTVFSVDGVERMVNLKALGLQGSYPAWHPSGRYVAFASTDTHQGFYHSSRDKIEVYDLGGKMFVYDLERGEEILDTRFRDSTLWHTFPAFSPDGRTLYYCRARAVIMPHQADSLHYELIAADFDPQTAQLGEERIIPIPQSEEKQSQSLPPAESHQSQSLPPIGGSRRGVVGDRSISFPRVSPDGRYLMVTVADCGTFPIWHKEADLAMIDLATGTAVDLSAVNSDDVESFHSWSRNSRWVVFSSRRSDGRYTRLFFSHIDAEGNASKPFLLPQSSPSHNIMRLDSYNVPILEE
ncbi:MAG: PD40 domain-containing protein [Bacteroidaceae bacterium]|nr:PD40 domain-containing protein [Bacteroidaceae bacterium]